MSSVVPAAGAADQPASPANPTAPASTPTDEAIRMEQRVTMIGGEVITVLVGAEHKPFIVHRDLICHFSPFFRAACNGPWIESKGTVLLPEDEPDSFDIYFKWLYSGNVVIEDRTERSRRAILAYVLGDKLLDNCFKNAFMDKFRDPSKSTYILSSTILDYLYKNTTRLSPMRKFAVDTFVFCARFLPTDQPYFTAQYPREFLQELVLEFAKVIQSDNNSKPAVSPWRCDPCHYHSHRDGQKCSPSSTG